MSAYLVLFSVLAHRVDQLVLSSVCSFPKTEAKEERESIIGKQLPFFAKIGVTENIITCQTPIAFILGHLPPTWPLCWVNSIV